jgi:hypothetical protein
VTPDGVRLDSIVVCNNSFDQREPSLSYGNGVYLTSWTDNRGPNHAIYSARLLPDGSVLDVDGFILHSDTMKQIGSASSFDGTNFIVIWCAFDMLGYGIYAKRVSTVGTILDSVPLEIAYGYEATSNPSIAFDGTNFLVVWDDARISGTELDIWAARVTPDGVLLDTNGIPVDTSPGYQSNSSVSFRYPYYLVVWSDDESGDLDIYGKRITTQGVVVDSHPLAICTAVGQQKDVFVMAGDERFCVTWSDGRLGYEDLNIWAEFVDSAGAGMKEISMVEPSGEPVFFVSPNPFSSATTITVSSISDYQYISEKELHIYDVSGRKVKDISLVPISTLEKSSHTGQAFLRGAEATWDGTDREGRDVPPGVYFCLYRAQGFQVSKKILRIQ